MRGLWKATAVLRRCRANFCLPKTKRTTKGFSGSENRSSFVKDGIGEYVINGETGAVNPAKIGTKAAANYRLSIPAGGEAVIRLRLTTRT